MELVTSVGFPARLFRAQLHYRDLTLATLVVKASYEVDERGVVTAVGNALPIYEEDQQTPLGTVESDVVPIKQGCDFAVYGNAVNPTGPVERMYVSVQVAGFSRTLQVSGDRTWVSTVRGVAASRTKPFVSMPLNYSQAFGGAAFDPSGIEACEPANPAGTGLCLSEGRAPGTRLPNVEEADQPITTWHQRPMPAGLLPLPRNSDLRGTRGVEVDLSRRTTMLTPLAFVFSHPRMHLPAYPAKAAVMVTGMSPATWQFLLPELHLYAEIALGARTHTLRVTPDTLCLLPGERRFWVVARRAFIYQFIPERMRQVRLTARTVPTLDGPFTTITREMESTTPAVPVLPPDLPENMPVPWDMLRELNPLTSILERLPLLASG